MVQDVLRRRQLLKQQPHLHKVLVPAHPAEFCITLLVKARYVPDLAWAASCSHYCRDALLLKRAARVGVSNSRQRLWRWAAWDPCRTMMADMGSS